MSLYVCVQKKVIIWKFSMLNPKKSPVIYPLSLQNICLQTCRNDKSSILFKKNANFTGE